MEPLRCVPLCSQTQDLGNMSHICYEGGCASNPKRHTFSSTHALCQPQNKCHEDTPEEETSLGNARLLKRKRDAEDEEQRKRQQLDAQLALEMANRELEPPPVWSTDHLPEERAFAYIFWQVPLLERTIDTGLQRSTELGGFLRASETHSQPRPCPSTSAIKIKINHLWKEGRLKHASLLLLILLPNLKTSRTPRKPTLLDYSKSIPLFLPTTRATQTRLETFPLQRLLPSLNPLDLA